MSMPALTVLMIRSKRPGELVERGVVAGGVVVVGAELEAVLLLAQRLRQHRDLGAHRVGELDRHVAEAAEADDGDLLARAGVPVAQRRVGGDAGAQQRRGGVELQAVGDAQDEVLVDDDVVGVAAVGDRAVAVDRAVGLRVARQAVLLLAGLAVLALAAGVDHAADADAVARRERRDLRADLGDDAGDLVARDRRVGDLAPLAAGEVDVGVADAAELDVDADVLRADRAALESPARRAVRRAPARRRRGRWWSSAELRAEWWSPSCLRR